VSYRKENLKCVGHIDGIEVLANGHKHDGVEYWMIQEALEHLVLPSTSRDVYIRTSHDFNKPIGLNHRVKLTERTVDDRIFCKREIYPGTFVWAPYLLKPIRLESSSILSIYLERIKDEYGERYLVSTAFVEPISKPIPGNKHAIRSLLEHEESVREWLGEPATNNYGYALTRENSDERTDWESAQKEVTQSYSWPYT